MYILAYGDPINWNMEGAKAKDEETTQCSDTSCLEKVLITLLILFVCGFCVLCSLLIIASVNDKCITADCIKQAAWIQSTLSQVAMPCEDFYKFVCPVTEDESKFGKMKETARKLQVIVEMQVEDLIKGPLMVNEDISLRVLKQMYRGCLDAKNQEQYLQETYHAILQWGLLAANDKYFDWIKYIRTAREHGLAYDLFLDISVVKNMAGNGEPILRIGPPDVLAADSITYTIDEATFAKKLDEITQKGLNNYGTELMTIQEFEEFYNFSPWAILPNQTIKTLENENYTVLVAGSEYFSELLDLLQKTEESIIANFMQRHLNNKLSNEFVQWTKQDYDKNYCARKVKQLLPHFTQVAYVKKYHTGESLDEAKVIAEGLKDELLTILRNADWLNKKTKNYILNKITNTSFVIGAPDNFIVNEFDFIRDDVNAITDTENFLLMTLKAKTYNHNRQYLTLEKEKHLQEELSDAVLSVYPFYSFKHNLIVVPAAVLQNPIFYLKRPRYLNYGLLGAIIGRELMRAFLRFAKESDEECLDVDWSWILQQIQCLEEQYSSYNYSDVSKYNIIKGEQIFTDVAGTKLAYRAYQNRIQVNELDRPLFGMNFTADQMFWIAKGLHGCYLLETFSANNPALSYMVISPFMNLEAFTDDFDCYKENFSSVQCGVL